MLVSVIVPCHNVSEYIDKCIKSILAQDYESFEIIAIDDGSTDDTYNKLLKFENVSNFRLFKQENMGLGNTRNVGITKACGEYCLFVDSDDWIEPRFISGLVNSVKGKEIAYCNRKYFSRNGTVKYSDYPEITNLRVDSNKINKISFNATNKIFRTDKLKEFGGFNPTIYEDIVLVFRFLTETGKIGFDSSFSYNVNQQNESSITSTFNKDEYLILKYLIDINIIISDGNFDFVFRLFWFKYVLTTVVYFNKKKLRCHINPLSHIFLSCKTLLSCFLCFKRF